MNRKNKENKENITRTSPMASGECNKARSGAEHAADEVRNANSRRILGNAELYAQFIRDNLKIPELANVQPEDIEDVSEQYQVVRIHDYTNEELMERGDAISLIMMINKIQSPEDFTRFCQSPPERLDEILKNTPGDIRDIIKEVMYGLLMKMKVPVGEAKQYVEMIEECRMGYLFENMEEMDIQAERRNTAEARKDAEEARKDAEEARKYAEKVQEALENMIKAFIFECQGFGRTREDTADRLVQVCGLAKKNAEEKLELYWKI